MAQYCSHENQITRVWCCCCLFAIPSNKGKEFFPHSSCFVSVLFMIFWQISKESLIATLFMFLNSFAPDIYEFVSLHIFGSNIMRWGREGRPCYERIIYGYIMIRLYELRATWRHKVSKGMRERLRSHHKSSVVSRVHMWGDETHKDNFDWWDTTYERDRQGNNWRIPLLSLQCLASSCWQ